MAETIEITTSENTAKIVVDGNEIRDVIRYSLDEDSSERTLTLVIAIKGSALAR